MDHNAIGEEQSVNLEQLKTLHLCFHMDVVVLQALTHILCVFVRTQLSYGLLEVSITQQTENTCAL